MVLGDMLKRIRIMQRITQDEIASSLKVSKSTIYRFEHGGSFSLELYIAYCCYIGIHAFVPIFICLEGYNNMLSKDNYYYDYLKLETLIIKVLKINL